MRRIPSLDGLRAVSILLVLIGHWFYFHKPGYPVKVYAHTGVQIFFVISGYLITGILLNERARSGTISLRNFYVRRAYRILPAATVFVILVSIAFRAQLTSRVVILALVYLLNYSPSNPWFLGHLWTLCNEEQFYLLWPGILKRFFNYKVPILVALNLVTPTYIVLCHLLKLPLWLAGTPFPAVVDVLAVGCLLAIYSDKIPPIPQWLGVGFVLPIILVPQFAATTPARTLLALFVLQPIMNFSIAGLVIHVVRHPYWILNVPPVTWLGRISYSVYLWQQPFFFSSASKPVWYPMWGIVLACLSYYLVEQPILRLREHNRRLKHADA